MIQVGDVWEPERGQVYQVTRIACLAHGELKDCRVVLEPSEELPQEAEARARCPHCLCTAHIEWRQLPKRTE